MKLTPSQVKNFMRRGLRLLVDPDPLPEERKSAFEFFRYQCAYCGIEITRKSGDLDHLISSSEGGQNHIWNRVPSCKPCNAEEKRELHWEQFLRTKCQDEAEYQARYDNILQWQRQTDPPPVISEATRHIIEEQICLITKAYDQAVTSVRRAKSEH